MAYGNDRQSFEQLRRSLSGELFEDSFNCGRYATDASIYQMMPHAVVIPKTYDDIVACLGPRHVACRSCPIFSWHGRT